MFLLTYAWATGETPSSEHNTLEEAIAEAVSHRDEGHAESDRDLGVQRFSPVRGSSLYNQGVLAKIDITRHGCVSSFAYVEEK